MFIEPRGGWPHVEVTNRHTKQDFAHCMQQLVDGCYPEAEVIRLVIDNLNTHTPAALYEIFPRGEGHCAMAVYDGEGTDETPASLPLTICVVR